MLDQMVRHLSHRCEPDQLACARARLRRIREYIHLATLECAERKAGGTSIARQSSSAMPSIILGALASNVARTGTLRHLAGKARSRLAT